MSIAKGSARMGTEIDYGRKQPNGPKIVELRKGKGIKQEDLAGTAKISERLLRDIERKNHPVPASTITAIAAELKVNPSDITLSTPDASPTKARSLLKLRTVRSATELSNLAKSADDYEWLLEIDPSTATAADMQAVMMTVHRLVKKYGRQPMESIWWDEFDSNLFGEIPRLAHLQDLLTRLGTNGVNVIAGTYTSSSLRSLEEGEKPDFPEFIVRVPGTTTKQVFKYVTRFVIRFVPCDVEEDVVPINPGRSLADFELDDDKIPF
jgi:transcriptional regulator with XRE-family HTH domain